MKIINQNINSLVKILLFWIAAFFLIVTLKEQINSFTIKYLVHLKLNNILTKEIYIITIVLLSYISLTKVKVINHYLFLNSIFACTIYSLFRFDFIEHKEWYFVSLLGILKYMDTIYILFIISFIPYLSSAVNKIKIRNKTTPQFSDNNPIERESDDSFGYSKDAQNLLKIIINNMERTNKGAIIIGLTGKWGKGKTSYLNLMRNHAIMHKDVILIRINVWQSHNYENMAKRFLSAIANGIDDITLKGLIHDYSKVIIDADISYLSKLLGIFSRRISKQSEDLFDIVGKKIKELNKCLIVQVDDLDRLTGDEILYTLKFIRNVASFCNTFFIVAYDNEYLKKRFVDLKIDSSYLEKIFNIIYPLPSIRQNEYNDLIKNEMANSLMLDANVKNIINEFMDIIDNNISLRNAKRLASSIQCGVSMLKDEDGNIIVDLLDYILIQYLQQINPKAYDFLANFRDNTYFTHDKCIKQSGLIYIINNDKGLINNNEKLTDEEYKTLLIKDVGEENINVTKKIFLKLFDRTRISILGISYVNSFPLYFKRTFNENLIRKKDFLDSLHNDVEKFKENLVKWYNSYDIFTLNNLICNHECNNEDDWYIFLECLLSITPKSYVSFWVETMEGREKFIPTPGLKIITKGTKEEKEKFYHAIKKFFFDNTILEINSIEVLQKKFTLLLYNQIISFNHSATDYIMTSTLSNKDIFRLYWDLYWKNNTSYNNFDEDFWYYIDQFNFYDKLELRDIAKKHIVENIDSFMKQYPINRISEYYYLQSLFTEYIVEKDRAHGSNKWHTNFDEFINSIEDKSPALIDYINGFNAFSKSK